MRVRARKRKSVATGVSPSLRTPSTSDLLPSPSIALEKMSHGGPLRDTEVESDGDGWASDDSCPSLRTVADSSDGEDGEDLPDGWKEALEADVQSFWLAFAASSY